MIATDKIKPIHGLDDVLALSRPGRKVVHCHGVFDLLHIGHIRYFEQARKHGDLLVVTVTADRHVNKGPNRPVFSETLRAEAVASLGCVDLVAINEWPTAVEAIGIIRPDFYVKGPDYKDAARDFTGGIAREEAAVEEAGGRLIITEDITFSSTNLINRFLPVFDKEVTEFLVGFGGRYPAARVVDYLQKAKELRVLVIGEAIIDEYHYCETLGKSGKEPILAAQFKSAERFAGGTLAIANHIATFAGSVRLVTELGEHDSHEPFVRGALHPAVDATLLRVGGAPTIVKRRFIETYPFQKLFEIYVMDEERMARSAEHLRQQLDGILDEFDAVIVADYGHGMLTDSVRDLVCERAKFLAVNAQVNAGNQGFNTVSKFRRADFISLSEKEIRLEARNQSGDLQEVVGSVVDRLRCDHAIVTRGVQGSLCYGRHQGFFKVPAFAVRTVDRVGAGDAVFAVASLCVALGAPIEVVGFIGNAVGTEAVSIVGNQRFIERVPLIKHIEALLK